MNAVISYYTVMVKISVTWFLSFFILFPQRTFELNYKSCSYKIKGTKMKISVIIMFVIVNYLSIRFYNSCRRLPETKRHSRLFLQ